ncbi:D-aminoacyl-tRNA deacylase 1-like [Macrosteles quadrilineatus]|uniref:D-aminoacyl-tRNA deacylase 1-like n=1 Tax=Macrosteles quadrilineatus TaxID=74068 RepID=UPI0023E1D9E1|nr:D-aminoacyl-tRNA deacylase 1-like [Macrosteles quadrilineatus]XP_054265295.1 D-aminoacyl-tRNA deacylase 1-like [Macrosteles quadrilineatus]
MRAVVQRVLETQIRDGNFITSTVTLGLCISVTFHKNDSIEDLNYMAKKVLNLKLFNDNLSNKPWKMDIRQKGYGITVLKEKRLISGFNGSQPIFDDAMETRFAYKFYKMFIKLLRQLHDSKLVKGTSFRKPVRVNIIHDGPAIFVLHSPKNMKRSPREKFIAAYGMKYFVD